MVRGIRERDINKVTRQVKKSAFIPRRNGNDDDGLSVSQPLSDTDVQLAKRMRPREPYYCSILAGQIRAIEVSALRLEVCPDPTEQDEFHALIKNVPTGSDMENITLSTRLAQLLAEASVEYMPPKESR
jgi:hypothetical protein